MRQLILIATVVLLCSSIALPANAQRDVPIGQYVAGGVVGTVVGFGIGHAIIGEYGNIGWVFTLGEVGGMAVMIAGFASGYSGVRSGNVDSGLGLMLGGTLIMLGFHIWEVVDVWTRVRPSRSASLDNESDTRFALVPTVVNDHSGSAGLGLAFSFSL